MSFADFMFIKTFGGNPFGILEVAQYLANSTQENIPRETESFH